MLGINRRWLVNYTFNGGTGRIFMTTKSLRLTEKLVKEMDDYLRADTNLPNACVKSAHPLGVKFGAILKETSE